MNTFKNTLIAGLFLATSGAGFAATQDIKFVSNLGTLALSTSYKAGSADAIQTVDYKTGQLQFENAGGASFIAYCVEVAQDHASARRGLQTYTVGSFSDTQATLLQGLFSSSFSSLLNGSQQAAFQTAIWEITHEAGVASLDVGFGQGQFSVKGLTSAGVADSQAFVATVNGYLGAAAHYAGPNLYTLTKLSNDKYQDLLTVTAVPEPSAFALMAAGLAGIGLIARRRKNRSV